MMNASILMTLSPSEEMEFLRSINAGKAKLLSPAIAYTVALMLIGTVGNPIAIYIYCRRWKNTTTRVFLLCLAVLDLINCVITMPTEICLMAQFYYFPDGDFCMISRFITYFINNATSALFLFIATDRYLRICRPHGWKFSVHAAKWACAASVCVGAVVSWPAIVLYGNKTVAIPYGGDRRGVAVNNSSTRASINVTGVLCNVKNVFDNTIASELFFDYLWCGFIVCVIILSIFYVLIGRAILKRRRKKRRMRNGGAGNHSGNCDTLIGKTHVSHAGASVTMVGANCLTMASIPTSKKLQMEKLQNPSKGVDKKNGAERRASIIKNLISSNHNLSDDQMPLNAESTQIIEQRTDNLNLLTGFNGDINQEKSIDHKARISGNGSPLLSNADSSPCPDTNSDTVGCIPAKSCRVNSWRTKVPRSTLMLFAITAVFILTFLPFLIIISVRQRVGPTFYQSLSPCEQVLVSIFSRSYLVNNCANPIVYGLVNEQFRSEMKRLFTAFNWGSNARHLSNVNGRVSS